MRDVFISHSQYDQPFIDQVLLPAFRSQGITAWYSKDDIKTSEEWERRIVQGLEDCEWFLVVLTEKAVTSTWVRAEVQWAMEHRQGKIVPVLLRECNVTAIHLLLNSIQYTDFRWDHQAGLRSLLWIWDRTWQPVNTSTVQAAATKPPVRVATKRTRRRGLMIVTPAVVLCSVLTIYYANTHKKGTAGPPAVSADSTSGKTIQTVQKHDPDTVHSARFYYNIGMSYYDHAEFRTAADYFSTALEYDPKDTASLIHRSECWMQLNDYAKARFDFRKVIPLVRDRKQLCYELGIAEYDLGNFQASVAAFTKAIEAGYPDPQVYVDRGDALRRAGQTPDACKDYNIAVLHARREGVEKFQEYCQFVDTTPTPRTRVTRPSQ